MFCNYYFKNKTENSLICRSERPADVKQLRSHPIGAVLLGNLPNPTDIRVRDSKGKDAGLQGHIHLSDMVLYEGHHALEGNAI